MMRSCAVLAVATLLCAAAPARRAEGLQGAAGAPAATFGAAVEVRVVNVEVVVTDAKGSPVGDLERDEFELEVDGRQVAISNFFRSVRPGELGAETLAGQLPSLSANAAGEAVVEAPRAPAAAPQEQRLRLFVWFDDLHTLPAHRNRIVRELGEFLDQQMARGAEVDLVRYDRKVEHLRRLAGSERPLAADLAQIAKRAASGLFAESARRTVFEEIETIYAEDGCGRVDDMTAAAARYRGPLTHDAQLGLGALEAWVSALAGVPGRRAILYVADGLPLAPGKEAQLLIDQLCGATPGSGIEIGLVQELQRVSSGANAAGITFYTFQAGGLPVGGAAEAMGRGLDAGMMFVARANLQDPLHQLAAETGGRALLDANKIAPLLDTLASDLETYYSLGFTPDGAADGRQHRIAVKLKRPGLRARHRTGFRDRTTAERRDERLLAALSFGPVGPAGLAPTTAGPVGNPLGVRLDAGPARAGGRDEAFLPLRVVIPAAALLFVPEGADDVARLEIALVAGDAEGGVSPIQTRRLSVARSKLAPPWQSALLRFALELRLRPGPAAVVVVVRDLGAELESFARLEREIP